MIKSGIINQYFASIFGNFASVSYSIGVGWSSPNLPLLLSEKTPLSSGPLSFDEVSWVSSILCVGGLFGTIFFGGIADKFGRKYSGILMAIPFIVGWFIIAFGKNVTSLYIARFLIGFGGGGSFIIIPLYISEISEDGKRGSLGSILMLSNNIGILFGYITGSFMDYQMMGIFTTIFPTLFLISFLFLPETPRYLLTKNKIDEAENSLKYYRSHEDKISGKFQVEFEILKINLVAQKTYEQDNKIKFKDFKSIAAKKAMIISFVLMSMTQFSGIFSILNYLSTILTESGSNLDPNISSIVVAIIQIIGVYISTILVDKSGRRFLLLLSFIGTAVGHCILGSYLYLKPIGYNVELFSLVPVTSISIILFFAALGVQTLPFFIISEIFPQNTRGLMVSCGIAWTWITSFLLLKYFVLLVGTIGLHGCIGIFGVCCILAAIFVYFYIPETKGISIEAIIALLNKDIK